MKPGDTVIYRGIKQGIEEVKDDSVLIMNDLWHEDADDEFVPFWIWVNVSELE